MENSEVYSENAKYYLEEADVCIKNNRFSNGIKALNAAVLYLEEGTESKLLDVAYSHLHILLDHTQTFTDIRCSVQKLLRISGTPYFAEKQQQLAVKIARWHFKKAKKDKENALPFYSVSLLYIGKAASFPAVSSEIHEFASRIFRKAAVQLSIFSDELWMAAGWEDNQKMSQISENFKERFNHLPTENEREEFYHLFQQQVLEVIFAFNEKGEERLEATKLKALHQPIKYKLSRKTKESEGLKDTERFITAR